MGTEKCPKSNKNQLKLKSLIALPIIPAKYCNLVIICVLFILTFGDESIVLCNNEPIDPQVDISHENIWQETLKCPYWTHAAYGAFVGYLLHFAQVGGQTRPFMDNLWPASSGIAIFFKNIIDLAIYVGISTTGVVVMLNPSNSHAAVIMGIIGTFTLRHIPPDHKKS